LQVVATVKKSPEIRGRNPERSFIVIVERSGKISRRLQNESEREHSQGNSPKETLECERKEHSQGDVSSEKARKDLRETAEQLKDEFPSI
jgi:hypothetical protein